MAVVLVLHRFLCAAVKHLALHFTPNRVPWDEPVEAEDVSHTLWHALVNIATFNEVLMDHWRGTPKVPDKARPLDLSWTQAR